MNELPAQESSRLLQKMDKGQFLTVVGGHYLTVKGRGRDLNKQEKNIVYDACKKVGIHFFTEMSFTEYGKNSDYPDKVDKLLALVQEYGIGMTCSLSKRYFYLKFIER